MNVTEYYKEKDGIQRSCKNDRKKATTCKYNVIGGKRSGLYFSESKLVFCSSRGSHLHITFELPFEYRNPNL